MLPGSYSVSYTHLDVYKRQYLQCANGCHDKLYYNEDLVREMAQQTKDCRIPDLEFIPSHDTFNRFFSIIKPEYFELIFRNWEMCIRDSLQTISVKLIN